MNRIRRIAVMLAGIVLAFQRSRAARSCHLAATRPGRDRYRAPRLQSTP